MEQSSDCNSGGVGKHSWGTGVVFYGIHGIFSKIDQTESSELAARVLLVADLDDLKARLAKVVLMILVVRFFEYALGMSFHTALNLLQFAGGIALLGLALYLSHLSEKKH